MKKKISSEVLCDSIINGMQEKKGFDIIKMDLRKKDNNLTQMEL